jgi:hypothetical protein
MKLGGSDHRKHDDPCEDQALARPTLEHRQKSLSDVPVSVRVAVLWALPARSKALAEGDQIMDAG